MVAPIFLFSSACGAEGKAAGIKVEHAGVGVDWSRVGPANCSDKIHV
jgi:hypothetical protein